jgi:2-polyprenyl-3-methyl-5-hydroxy-6-metoxy-1,4-benzoquinol methylase
MFEVWDKKKITRLSNVKKQQWFDVLNYRLEEDRDISLDDSELITKQKEIKDDYIKYLESCPYQDNFFKYYVFIEDDIIVSVCRINMINDRYILEGLQTHKDYFHKGYAMKLINHMMYDLKKEGITTIYSEVRTWNSVSHAFHHKLGFIQYGEENQNYLFQLDVNTSIRRQLFDTWASGYHHSVISSEKLGTYPFAGYSELKYRIFELITQYQKTSILDMGVGDGKMIMPLYQLGYTITGIDLSLNMIELAKSNMPNASFIHGEFHEAISLLNQCYDAIVFSYAIHHLTYHDQIDLLLSLNQYLHEEGMIIIGDVSTKTQHEMELLREKYIDIWDDEEYYPIESIYQQSELIKHYVISYVKINDVAAIFQFTKKLGIES